MVRITINDRVRDCNTDKVGTVIEYRNGFFFVRFDDGDEKAFLEHEIYLDVGFDWQEVV